MALTFGGLKQHILLALGGQPSVVSGVTQNQRIAEIVNQAGNYLFSKQWRFRERTARPLGLTANQNWAALPGDAEDIISIVAKAGLGWRVELTTPEQIDLLRNSADPSLHESIYYAALSRPWAESNGTTPLTPGTSFPSARLDIYPTPQTTQADALIIRYRSGWTAVSGETNAVTPDTYVIPIPPYIEALIISYCRAFAMAYEDEGLAARLIEIDNGPIYNAAAIKDGIQQRDYGRLPTSIVGPFRRESLTVSQGFGAGSGVLTPATALSNIRWRGLWNANDQYAIGDVVRSGSSVWIAVIGNSNSVPPSTHWELMVTDGFGISSSGTVFLSNTSLALTSNKSISGTTEVLKFTLNAGTWLVTADVLLNATSGTGQNDVSVYIEDAVSATTYASGHASWERPFGPVNVSMTALVALASSASIRLSALTFNNFIEARATTPLGQAKATQITAVRVA